MEGFKLPIHEGTLQSEAPIGVYGHYLLEPLHNCGWLLVNEVVSSGESNGMTDCGQEGNAIYEEYVP